jgi:uncharacterized C2H2 Zn-finger protein
VSKKQVATPNEMGDGRYQCPLDKMVFETKIDFDRHFRKVHIAEAGLI